MRSDGYKCCNVNCGSCVGHSLCGEPADTALGCVNRIVWCETNADRIRSMTDEELAKEMRSHAFALATCSEKAWLKWLKQPVGGNDND